MIYVLLWIIDNIIPAIFWLFIALGIINTIILCCLADAYEHATAKDTLEYKSKGKKAIRMMIIWFILAIIIPSEKTMYKMLAVYGVKEVVESNIGQKSLLLLEKKLDNELKDK